MDDVVYVSDNISKALAISHETIMKKGNFNLRKWLANDKSFLEEWKKEGLKIYALNSYESKTNTLKVLGITWNVKNTKGFVLQILEKQYDSTGIITSFTVRLKILFQK